MILLPCMAWSGVVQSCPLSLFVFYDVVIWRFSTFGHGHVGMFPFQLPNVLSFPCL